jgi:hypothetical protein
MPNKGFETQYSTKAKEDIRDVVLWYNLQKPGLENEFLASLELSVTSLKINPTQYQRYFR